MPFQYARQGSHAVGSAICAADVYHREHLRVYCTDFHLKRQCGKLLVIIVFLAPGSSSLYSVPPLPSSLLFLLLPLPTILTLYLPGLPAVELGTFAPLCFWHCRHRVHIP